MSRVSEIESVVRRKLDTVANYRVLSGDIYSAINRIQAYLMLETKCVEKAVTISTVASTESYSIASNDLISIVSLFTSWDGDIEFVSNAEWPRYRSAAANYPVFATIQANKIYLRPIPTSVLTITLWGYQHSVGVLADANNEPEVPKYCDNALIYGVCKELTGEAAIDPQSGLTFYQEFIGQVDLIKRNATKKYSYNRKPARVW